jgi:hypothetical protein
LRCPTCSGSLWELDWRWRIPRKTNDKGWKELATKVSVDSAVLVHHRRRIGAAKIAKIDEQIVSLEKQCDSERKTASLKKLRSERTQISSRYA